MKKNIWIMNHYAAGMMFQKGGRHYSIAKYLKIDGYNPVVFSCNTKHGVAQKWVETEKLWVELIAEEIQVPFVLVSARLYNKNDKNRVLNMVDFFKNVKKAAKEYATIHGKPDVIYASSVHPLTLLAGIQLAKFFNIKCICEIRDLWPESIVAYTEKWKKSNPIIKLLYEGEKYIYKRANAIVFTMEGAYDYIIEKGWEKDVPSSKVYFVNNGVDLEEFEYNKLHFQIHDLDLENPHFFKVIYVGSIRKVNNIGALLDMAKKILDPQILILIWGDGNEREYLQKRANKEGIKNVVFKGYVAKKYVPYIVSRADLNIVHNQAEKIANYGLSLNKMFEYLAAGKPILFDFPSKHNPAVEGGAAVETVETSSVQIASAIESIRSLSEESYSVLCQNSIKTARKYDFKSLAKKVEAIIESL